MVEINQLINSSRQSLIYLGEMFIVLIKMFPFDSIGFVLGLILLAKIIHAIRKPVMMPAPDEDINTES
jgi:hypothetical protein